MEPDSTPRADDWTGVLGVGLSGLRLRLRAPNGFDGPVTLFSLDQGAAPIPGVARTSADGTVTIAFASIGGTFVGRQAGGRLDGAWRQGAQTPLAFVQGEAGLARAARAPLTLERLEALRTGSGAPGMVAAAQATGRAPLILATGRRAVNATASVTQVDRWHIGSITKSMTAVLAARLIEQGALSWDDTLGDVFGSAIEGLHGAYRGVTLVHLLSHRAGLPGNPSGFELLRFQRAQDPLPAQRLDYCRLMLTKAPVATPGSQFSYSNAGFIAAGAMLEAKTQTPWESLMQTHLFEPLGMRGAGFGAPPAGEDLAEPLGHSKAFFGEQRVAHRLGHATVDNPAVMGPAGVVHARASDMLAYLAAHRDRGPVLRRESWRRLHTPPFGGDDAMGWRRQGDILWHNGSNTLWYAEAMVGPAVVAFAGANDGHVAKSQPAVAEALAAAAAALS